MPERAPGRCWPAIEVRTAADPDRLAVAIDDTRATAIEERDPLLRIFFDSPAARDEALAALSPCFDVSPVDVPDENWARRSQQNLGPVTVGAMTIAPPWDGGAWRGDNGAGPALRLIIEPSTGFGTGHHETTRLGLAALQTIDLTGAVVLDLGTGSGVLALAAIGLGAAHAVGLDDDADALQSAAGNLARNPQVDAARVELCLGDLEKAELPPSDVVVANLTGALLVRAAGRIDAATRPGGTLIVSGLLTRERDEVRNAFGVFDLVAETEEGDWACLILRRPTVNLSKASRV
jgi:ribosomal protein L11 methyltransferase